jgi:hypothetical protein
MLFAILILAVVGVVVWLSSGDPLIEDRDADDNRDEP